MWRRGNSSTRPCFGERREGTRHMFLIQSLMSSMLSDDRHEEQEFAKFVILSSSSTREWAACSERVCSCAGKKNIDNSDEHVFCVDSTERIVHWQLPRVMRSNARTPNRVSPDLDAIDGSAREGPTAWNRKFQTDLAKPLDRPRLPS